MIPVILAVGYIGGVVIGLIIALAVWYAGFPITGAEIIMLSLAVGGLASTFLGMFYWQLIPGAVRNLVKAWKKGYIVVAIGKDRKAHLLPAESDGYLLKPVDKKYEKYRWATDGESLHPVHNGKGLQLAVAYMGASHVVDGVMAAAATKYAELGYETIDDLKTACELPSPEAVREEIARIEELIRSINGMKPEEVQEKYGEDKDILLARLEAEHRRLQRLLALAEKYGGGPPALNMDGIIVRPGDVIKYFAWRTDPNIVDRIVLAETNAVLARIGRLKQYAGYIVLLIGGSIAAVIVLAALHMLLGGGGSPAHAVQHVANTTHAVHQVITATPINATG